MTERKIKKDDTPENRQRRINDLVEAGVPARMAADIDDQTLETLDKMMSVLETDSDAWLARSSEHSLYSMAFLYHCAMLAHSNFAFFEQSIAEFAMKQVNPLRGLMDLMEAFERDGMVVTEINDPADLHNLLAGIFGEEPIGKPH
jgi:hypothetical protein